MPKPPPQTPHIHGTFTLSGGGNSAFSGHRSTHGGAALSTGDNALSFTATTSRAGAFALSGGGSPAASGSVPAAPAVSGSFSVDGGGAPAAAGTRGALADLPLSGGGAVAALGRTGRFGDFSLSGGGALAATGSASVPEALAGSFALSGGGNLAASDTAQRMAVLVLGGGGDPAANGSAVRVGELVLSGGGSPSIVHFGGRTPLFGPTGASFALAGGGHVDWPFGWRVHRG